jgi:hypothetical protein
MMVGGRGKEVHESRAMNAQVLTNQSGYLFAGPSQFLINIVTMQANKVHKAMRSNECGYVGVSM